MLCYNNILVLFALMMPLVIVHTYTAYVGTHLNSIILTRFFNFKFFFNLCGGTLGTAAITGLLYQPRMIGDGDCGEIGGMKIGRGNQSTRRKPAPTPLCPPQIPHD
jgi:hypothetical protein